MFQFTPYKTSQISVAATVGGTQLVGANNNRSGVLIINHGTTVVYLGESGVTTSTGIFLAGSAGASIAFATTSPIYGITASGSQTVSILETL